MKVIVTGGSGFIGSHIVERLLQAGSEVVVIDNFSTGRRDNLAPHAKLKVIEGTIADRDLVNKMFADFQPDQVVHAAAGYKDPDDWYEDAMTNVVGTINLAKAALAHKVQRFIYFQTALCYGLHPKEQPITITYPRHAEGSSYAFSKTAGEEYIELSGLDFLSFRLANAYGPRNLSGPLPTFYQRLTAGKACFVMDTRRDFIFVDDVVEVAIRALNGQGKKGHYHISSGSDFSIKELFDATLTALDIKLDAPVEVRPRGADDAFTILLDPSKTNADFGWKASTPLTEGVKRAIEYYRKFGITQSYTHLRMHEDSKK
ncbi:MAG: SDR family NAD(P)-dependent oxidoreductase [Polyangiaceae bacterium]|nr:SDR family NAD(P)-dependent oxidoreductase [Polyangiaceae bacterium]